MFEEEMVDCVHFRLHRCSCTHQAAPRSLFGAAKCILIHNTNPKNDLRYMPVRCSLKQKREYHATDNLTG